MPDLTLTCQDCHNEFVWSQDEQQFYQEKNLSKPQYCPICRGKYQAHQKDLSQYQKGVK